VSDALCITQRLITKWVIIFQLATSAKFSDTESAINCKFILIAAFVVICCYGATMFDICCDDVFRAVNISSCSHRKLKLF